jgi:hypothetical protein
MWEAIRQRQEELVNGLNSLDEEYAKDHRGFRVVKVFHQTDPIEALVLYFEANNLDEAFHPRHRDHETVKKWNAFWAQVAGLSGPFMAERPELLVDWHHHEGHRHKAAPRGPKL